MAYKKLSQLTANGQAWNIKVKVIRMWKSINFASDELMSLDMILMDNQGETIRATIWKNLIDNFKPKIVEGCIYELNNFKVQEDGRYRPVKNTLKIVFIYNTNIKKVKENPDKFQDYYFEFASRDTLLARKNIDTQCSDVMGLLTRIKQIESRTILKNTSNSRQRDIREIELLISRDHKVKLTLWGDLAHSLSEDVIGKHTVVIVTSVMVEGLQGMLSLKTTNGTRLYIDLDIPEIIALLFSIPYEENVPKLMEVDKSTQGTLKDQMFYNRRTLQEITQMRHDNPNDQDCIFTSRATIDQLDNDLWWYMSCNNCNKMCTKVANRYHCSKCNTCPESTPPRYWIRLRISDHTAATTCSIFDDEARRMLKTSITNLLDSVDGNSEEIPKIILDLCGKTFIFRFKLSDQNLTQGKEYYLVKRTFDIDDKLELKCMDDKAEEHPIKEKSNEKEEKALAPAFDELEVINRINRHEIGQDGKNTYDEQERVDQLELNEEIHNDKSGCKGKKSSMRKLNVAPKKRRRAMIVIDDSDEESKESHKKKVKVSDSKSKKRGRRPVDANVDNDFDKKKKALEQALKTAARLEKRLYGKKTTGDVAENSESKSTMKDSRKTSRRLNQKKRRTSNYTEMTTNQLNTNIDEANAKKTSNIDDLECPNIGDNEAKGRKTEKERAKVKKTIQKRRKETKIMVHTKIPNNKEEQQSNVPLNDSDMDSTISGKDNNINLEDVGELSNSDKDTIQEKSNEETNNSITREGTADPTKGNQAPTLYRSTRNRMLPVRYRN
ncbi:unnamed protein product [Urochloa humidicola]